jgi:hypothetical protein
VQLLQPVLQHRAIDFFEHVEAHFDPVVWAHAKNVAIERGVMELAERDAVRHLGLAFRV